RHTRQVSSREMVVRRPARLVAWPRATTRVRRAVTHRSDEPMDQPEAPASDVQRQLYQIADELRSIGNSGRYYAANSYELERAEQTLKLAARLASLVDTEPLPLLTALFDDDWMHVSPRLGVNAYVQNPAGEVLLLKRADNGLWCMPGGVSEIGESPSEACLRELWEEGGLRGEIVRLVGAFDSRLWHAQTRTHMLMLAFLVECADLTPEPGSEMTDARFYSLDALPPEMSASQARIVPVSGNLVRSGGCYVDPASTYGIDLPMHQRPGHLPPVRL
ncbi:MAG: NUDIX hydrolase, partial [Chloroflexota bacterium]